MHVRDIMHTVKRNFAKWQSYGTGWAGETTLYLMRKSDVMDVLLINNVHIMGNRGLNVMGEKWEDYIEKGK